MLSRAPESTPWSGSAFRDSNQARDTAVSSSASAIVHPADLPRGHVGDEVVVF
jgi:hypothetical protein